MYTVNSPHTTTKYLSDFTLSSQDFTGIAIKEKGYCAVVHNNFSAYFNGFIIQKS